MDAIRWQNTDVGKIPEEWNIKTIEELIKEKILFPPLDGNHGNIHPKHNDFVDQGIPFIMASDIVDGNIIFEHCKYITEKQAKTLKKGFAQIGDVLLTHKATIGRTCLIKRLFTDYIILTPQVTYYRIRNQNMLNNVFLKYYFEYDAFQNLFEAWAGTGSTRAYIGILAQHKLPIIIPPIKNQLAIGSILDSLDNKINLNKQINKKLKEMAQAIFKHWFIDFEFPDENGNPYKSSGGEIIDNDLIIRPKGWEITTLYNIASYINGSAFKPHELGQTGIPVIKIAELKNGIISNTKFYEGKKDKKYYLKNGDILFSWSGSPETSIGIFLWYSKKPAILNQHIFRVIPNNDVEKEFLFFILNYYQDIFVHTAKNKQTTGLGHVTINDLKRLNIIYPPQDVMLKFHRYLKPIVEKIHLNYMENNVLIEIRNNLLPKLISGEIRVSDCVSYD